MTPLPVSTSLAEASALTAVIGVGPQGASAETSSASGSAARGGLALGQFVEARVTGMAAEGPIVDIGQQLYALKLPTAVSMGQVLRLQVLETDPALQFRLVTNAETPPNASTQVDLITAQSLAGTHEEGAPPSLAPSALNPSPEASLGGGAQRGAAAGGALVDSSALTDPTALGARLSERMQSQFESQVESHVESQVGSGNPDAANSPAGTAQAGALPGSAASEQQATLVHADGAAPASAERGISNLATDGPGLAPGTPASPAGAADGSPGVAAATGDGAARLAASGLQGGMPLRPNATASTLQPAVWQGQVWPGQTAEVTIEPDRGRAAFEAPALNAWRATLKLTLPHLGQVNAQIMWNTAGLRISVDAADAESANRLRNQSGDLLESLRSLDMRIQSLGVRHG